MRYAHKRTNSTPRQRPTQVRQARGGLKPVPLFTALGLLGLFLLSNLTGLAIAPQKNKRNTSPSSVKNSVQVAGRGKDTEQLPPKTLPTQAQITRNVLTTKCDGQTYNVGVAMANATLSDGNPVKSLGLILSAPTADEPIDAFCLYWVGKQSSVPTHLDDLSANGSLKEAGGVDDPSQAALAGLFHRHKCEIPTPLVSTLLNAKQAQGLRELLAAIPDRDEDAVAVEAKPDELNPFTGLPDASSFAQSVHQYIQKAIQQLRVQRATKKELQSLVNNLTSERNEWKQKAENAGWGLFEYGALAFAFVLGLALGGAGVYFYFERWEKQKVSYEPPKQEPSGGTEAASAQAVQQLAQAQAELRGVIDEFQRRFANEVNPKQKQSAEAIKHNPQHMLRLWLDLVYRLGIFRDQSLAPTQAVIEPPSQPGQPAAAPAETSSPQGGTSDSPTQARAIIESYLQQHTEAVNFLSSSWALRYQKAYCGQPAAPLANELHEGYKLCQALYAKLTGDNPPQDDLIERTAQSLQQVQADVNAINIEQYQSRLGQTGQDVSLKKIVAEVKRTKALELYLCCEEQLKSSNKYLLGYYNPAQEALLTALKRIVREHGEALRLLHEKNDERRINLLEAVQRTLQQIQRAAEERSKLEAELKQTKDQLSQAKVELWSSDALASVVAEQLHFKLDALASGGKTVSLLVTLLQKEQKDHVYTQLRLGLSAALLNLGEAIEQGHQHEQSVVLEALDVEEIRNGLQQLLEEIQQCSGRALWEQGLFRSFQNGWLHNLFRAELLLPSYFAGQSKLSSLHEGVKLAAASVRVALQKFEIKLGKIELFELLPSGVETQSVYPKLRNLPEVGEKIRQRLATDYRPFIIDVVAFPFRDYQDSVKASPGRAVLVNPSAWEKG